MHDLLAQRRSSDDGSFRWYLSDNFMTSIIQICENLKLKPGRVLSAAFEQETLSQISETESIYGGVLKALSDLVTSWADSFPDISELLKRCSFAISKINEDVGNNRQIGQDDFAFSLRWLAEAINKVTFKEIPEKSEPRGLFCSSWLAPENIDDLSSYARGNFAVPENRSKLYCLLHNHTRAVTEMIKILTDQVRGEGVARLNGRQLTVTQLQKIHSLRMNFLSQMYEGVVDGTCSILEEGIRETIYPCLRALWGKDAINPLPNDIKENLPKLQNRGTQRTKRDSDDNFFYDMSRSEYVKVIFSGTVKKALFSGLNPTPDISSFKESLELSFSLDDRNAHRDRKEYFSQHATEIGDILKSLPRNLEIFQSLIKDFLLECKCDLSQMSTQKSLQARFKPNLNVSPNTVVFTIDKDIVDRTTRKLLESLLYSSLVPENLNVVFSYSELEPEILITVFRALLTEGFVEIQSDLFMPIVIQMTLKGKELLKKYGSSLKI